MEWNGMEWNGNGNDMSSYKNRVVRDEVPVCVGSSGDNE